MTEVVQALRHIRDRRARLLFGGTVAAVLGLVVLIGVNYVLKVTRASTRAETARSQLDALADTLLDDMFNRLSIRERRLMLERLIRLPLIVMPNLPDCLLRESMFRFTSRLGTAGRMRLLAGDTAGAQAAFMRMLWSDELNVSGIDIISLRRWFTAHLQQTVSAEEGRAEPRAALALYEQASAFYAQKRAGGNDTERWKSRLAMVCRCLSDGPICRAGSCPQHERPLRSPIRHTASCSESPRAPSGGSPESYGSASVSRRPSRAAPATLRKLPSCSRSSKRSVDQDPGPDRADVALRPPGRLHPLPDHRIPQLATERPGRHRRASRCTSAGCFSAFVVLNRYRSG